MIARRNATNTALVLALILQPHGYYQSTVSVLTLAAESGKVLKRFNTRNEEVGSSSCQGLEPWSFLVRPACWASGS